MGALYMKIKIKYMKIPNIRKYRKNEITVTPSYGTVEILNL